MGAALRFAHVLEGADDLDAANRFGSPYFRTEQVAPVRRLVTRNEREQRRAIFCELVRPRGATATVARAWGVSDTVVRKVRDGLAPLTDERIAALPASMRAALDHGLSGPVQLRLEGI